MPPPRRGRGELSRRAETLRRVLGERSGHHHIQLTGCFGQVLGDSGGACCRWAGASAVVPSAP